MHELVSLRANRQHRARGLADHFFGDASQQQMRRKTTAVCPHHNHVDLPVAGDLLRCRRKTSKQGTLSPGERAANVRGAFTVSRGYDISDATVLVVDDVMTTGATANEVARVLLRAGAKSVSIVVVARGIGFS